MPRLLSAILLAAWAFAAAGCAGMSHTDNGALIGAGLGTATGALIGQQSGHGGAGAAIGAVTGAMAGSLIGSAEDAREERDAALAYAHHVRQSEMALTNADVVNMVHNGVGDQVIINAVQANGGRFDLSPQALIHLKQQGLSDNLISQMQRQPSWPLPPLVVAEPQPVFVRPAPAVRTELFIGSGRPFYGRHWHHQRWHHHHHDHW